MKQVRKKKGSKHVDRCKIVTVLLSLTICYDFFSLLHFYFPTSRLLDPAHFCSIFNIFKPVIRLCLYRYTNLALKPVIPQLELGFIFALKLALINLLAKTQDNTQIETLETLITTLTIAICSVPNTSTGLLLDIVWSHNKSSSCINIALLSNSQQNKQLETRRTPEAAETDFLPFTLNQTLKPNSQKDQNTSVLKNKERITRNPKPSINPTQKN